MNLRHLIPLTLAAAVPVSSAAERQLGFNSDVRPILSDRCFACHGFDAKTREADLRLDTPEGAFAGGKSGPAIVPGDPNASPVWQRINSPDPDEVMPPSASHLSLDPTEKELIRTWIEQGAKYEKHWTFARIERPVIPPGEAHPLDALILDRLKKEGLTFSPEADRRTLIRRLSLDLRGLPPTPAEVQRFLDDSTPQAWDSLVDRFLADPAFGERMAWPWLDAARYADTNGFQGDNERTMWPWRDWVIEAFNRNLPFDDFTVWQIAGDLLPNATHEQKLASGFLRNHPINGEGGSIPEENRVNYVMEMAETVGTTWMALTMNCCRCHDHKYDALTQENYYGLFDFFNHTPVDGSGGDPQTPPNLPAPSEEQRRQELHLVGTIAGLEQSLGDRKSSLLATQASWEKEQLILPEKLPWQPLTIKSIESDQLTFDLLEDRSALLVSDAPDKADYQVALEVPTGPIAAIRVEALRDPSMTKGGIGPSDSGNFVLTDFKATLVSPDGIQTPITFTSAEATYEQGPFKIENTLDRDPESGWAIWNGKSIEADHAALFRLNDPLDAPPGSSLKIILRHQSPHLKHLLGRFRISIAQTQPPGLKDSSDSLIEAIKRPIDQRDGDETRLIEQRFLESDVEYQRLTNEITAARGDLAQLRKAIPKVMIMSDREEARESFILAVGSYQDPGKKVTAHTPDFLPPLNPAGPRATRLDLARWLVSRDHPLTARVIVNRLWQEFFGVGFIKSAEDFGVQSEIPKHPEALDWLATELIESGWNYKQLIRAIVTSRTYRQSSKVTPDLLEHDPENRLLARGARFRMPAWMIRDQALAVSGMLLPQIGGEPVKPWQPPGLWAEVTFGGGKKTYVPDKGDQLRRRSLYTFWRRISAPPMFFDSAKRETCEVTPGRTNSPLHALAILNDPLYAEAARVLASRALTEGSDDPLSRAFEITLARPASRDEVRILREMYDSSRTIFQSDPAAATTFLSIGETPNDPAIDPIEHAALASVCLSLFNTDEALSKE